jgi:hypothetical protein
MLGFAANMDSDFISKIAAFSPSADIDTLAAAHAGVAHVFGVASQAHMTAILDSLPQSASLAAMGIAISPRGDMLENRVPRNARAQCVGHQLHLRG